MPVYLPAEVEADVVVAVVVALRHAVDDGTVVTCDWTTYPHCAEVLSVTSDHRPLRTLTHRHRLKVSPHEPEVGGRRTAVHEYLRRAVVLMDEAAEHIDALDSPDRWQSGHRRGRGYRQFETDAPVRSARVVVRDVPG